VETHQKFLGFRSVLLNLHFGDVKKNFEDLKILPPHPADR
jgi:hypothetical protein